MRWRWMGRRLPPFMRGSTRARLRFQRQRAPSIGCRSTAWVEAPGARPRSRACPAHGSTGNCAVGRARARRCRRRRLPAIRSRRRHRSACCRANPRARLMRPPNGACTISCEPSLSSKQRSTTMRSRVGRWARAQPARRRSRPPPAGRTSAETPARWRTSVRAPSPSPARSTGSSPARRSETASDSSAVRAGASPSQKGMVGGRSPASYTRTVPTSTLATRHEWVPRRKMSPAVASTAKSSCTEPTVTPSGSSTTR